MVGGNKKNKRGSVQSSPHTSAASSVFPKTELIVRTSENDYGVLSDPDEQPTITIDTTDDTTSTATATATANATVTATAAATTATGTATTATTDEGTMESSANLNSLCLFQSNSTCIPILSDYTTANDHEYTDNQDEPLPTSRLSQHSSPHSSSQSSPHSSPLSQDQSLSIPQLTSQSPTSTNSLEALKIKLARDISIKITLPTFFSYIIFAIELQTSLNEQAHTEVSVKSVEELVVYMIKNHSSSESVRKYLLSLFEAGVVTNIIESIIEYNNDHNNSSVETLYKKEENEIEMYILRTSAVTRDNSVTSIDDVKLDNSPARTTEYHLPQTPQQCGFFNCMRRFFSGCCG